MSRSLRRGALAAAAIAFSIASLAACGAGNNAQTLEVKPDNAATTRRRHQDPERDRRHPARGRSRRARPSSPRRSSTTARTEQTLDAITVPGAGDRRAHARQGHGHRSPSRPAARVILGGEGNASAVIARRPRGRQGRRRPAGHLQASARPATSSLRAFVVPAEQLLRGLGPERRPDAAAGAAAAERLRPPAPSGTPAAGATADGAAGDAEPRATAERPATRHEPRRSPRRPPRAADGRLTRRSAARARHVRAAGPPQSRCAALRAYGAALERAGSVYGSNL